MIPLKNPTALAIFLPFLCKVDARGIPGSNESLVNAEPLRGIKRLRAHPQPGNSLPQEVETCL